METFEMLEGYDEAYTSMLECALDGLTEKAKTSGLSMKEDNMRHQLKRHLGINTNLLSESAGPKVKDIGIESYN
jgi:hypothetical protein